MDIEEHLQDCRVTGVLQNINNFPTSKIYNQKICLENQFISSTQLAQQKLLLTLVDNILLICDLSSDRVEPFAAVELTFDLKFQIIYTIEKNIFSPKLGIRLFYDSLTYNNFYSNNITIIQLWCIFLSKKINQKGFHEIFKPTKKLGKGNFASVYEVQRLTDKRKFAVKAFSKQNAFSVKNGKESLINELNIMRSLSLEPHQNVLKLQGVYQSDNSIYVVLELLTGGQLFHKIQQNNGYFSKEDIRTFMLGLLRGASHLHSNRIMHRDIKPENIMLKKHGSMEPVIVDFGLATPSDIDKYLFFRCGTPGYVAPEIIELNQSKHIEPECDLFSIGVIFHILLTRKAVFEGTKYDEVYKKNKEMKIDFNAEIYKSLDNSALDLLKKMLTANPKDRITAQQSLKHQYFDWESSEMLQQKLMSPCLTEVSNFSDNKVKKAYYAK